MSAGATSWQLSRLLRLIPEGHIQSPRSVTVFLYEVSELCTANRRCLLFKYSATPTVSGDSVPVGSESDLSVMKETSVVWNLTLKVLPGCPRVGVLARLLPAGVNGPRNPQIEDL